MNQVHLLVLVAHFVWNGLSHYASTPEGQADLADIEAIVNELEHPTNQQPQTPGDTTGTTASGPQIIRK